jgi:hypothetical protein
MSRKNVEEGAGSKPKLKGMAIIQHIGKSITGYGQLFINFQWHQQAQLEQQLCNNDVDLGDNVWIMTLFCFSCDETST